MSTQSFTSPEEQKSAIIEAYKKHNKDQRSDSEKDDFVYKIIATIGVELEKRFPNFFNAGSKNELYGRRKSNISYSSKQDEYIGDFEQAFSSAINEGTNLPKSIKPILDNFACRLVCYPLVQVSAGTTENEILENYYSIINTVINDFLSTIEKTSPEYSSEAQKHKNRDTHNYMNAVNFINNFSGNSLSISLSSLVQKAESHKDIILRLLNYLKAPILDTTSCTYQEWHNRMLEYYGILLNLSYQQSTDEIDKITQECQDEVETPFAIIESIGLSDQPIGAEFDSNDEEHISQLRTKSHEQENAIRNAIFEKLTNKLDLDLLSLMFFDVINNSEDLKDLGVSISNIKGDNAIKRKPNGYISNFFILYAKELDIYLEFQIQPIYRYIAQKVGLSSHNNYKSDEDTLPEELTSESVEQIIQRLPSFFKYIGNGVIEKNSWFQNFQEFYSGREDFDKILQQILPTLLSNQDLGGLAIIKNPPSFTLEHLIEPVESTPSLSAELPAFTPPPPSGGAR